MRADFTIPLIATVASVGVVVSTLAQVARVDLSDPSIAQDLDACTRINLARILVAALLILACIGLVWTGVDFWKGNASDTEIWGWLGKVGLGEALSLSALQKIRKKIVSSTDTAHASENEPADRSRTFLDLS
jgi:hypothetical protein